MTEPVDTASPAAARTETPRGRAPFWNRVATRLGLALPEPTPDLLRGERHTLLGMAVAGAANVALLVFLAAVAFGQPFDPLAAVASQLPYVIVGAGLLAGSRIARWLVRSYGVVSLLFAAFYFAYSSRFAETWRSSEKAAQLGGPWIMSVMAAGFLVFGGGLLLASMSPWASRWQEARRALWRDRSARRGRSLDDWRASAAGGDEAR